MDQRKRVPYSLPVDPADLLEEDAPQLSPRSSTGSVGEERFAPPPTPMPRRRTPESSAEDAAGPIHGESPSVGTQRPRTRTATERDSSAEEEEEKRLRFTSPLHLLVETSRTPTPPNNPPITMTESDQEEFCAFLSLPQTHSTPTPTTTSATASTSYATLAHNSGQTVYAQGAAATPVPLLDAMTEVGKAAQLRDIKVVHMHTEKEAAYVAPECKDIFRSCSLFMAANVRKSVAEGRSDAIPIFLQDIPKLFHRKIIQPDIAVIQVSPPDQHGYCSLGTSVDCVRAALVNSKIIIAQVNVNMPRTFGDAIIHVSHIDYAVEDNTPLPEHGVGKAASPEETRIGELIGQNLVEDGATLQMGIGSIPDAVLSALKNHKDLGIHSEMFSVGVIDLVRRGCVTNNKKKNHKGRIVGSFLVGNKELYDFVDNNPFIEMLEIDYVNNTHIVSLQPTMTAINSCIEVDLTGQVCADSIGTRMYSGFGGQVDFIRGAAESVDGRGKPIIALVSTTKKNETKIVPTLKLGAGVVTSRAHVHYVVTEQGIAFLFGKTLRQRAYELIKVAHPDHREALEKAAFERLKCMPAP